MLPVSFTDKLGLNFSDHNYQHAYISYMPMLSVSNLFMHLIAIISLLIRHEYLITSVH